MFVRARVCVFVCAFVHVRVCLSDSEAQDICKLSARNSQQLTRRYCVRVCVRLRYHIFVCTYVWYVSTYTPHHLLKLLPIKLAGA